MCSAASVNTLILFVKVTAVSVATVDATVIRSDAGCLQHVVNVIHKLCFMSAGISQCHIRLLFRSRILSTLNVSETVCNGMCVVSLKVDVPA